MKNRRAVFIFALCICAGVLAIWGIHRAVALKVVEVPSYGTYNPGTKAACWGRTGDKLVCFHYPTREWGYLTSQGKISFQQTPTSTPPNVPPGRVRVGQRVALPGGYVCQVTSGPTMTCYRVGRYNKALIARRGGLDKNDNGFGRY